MVENRSLEGLWATLERFVAPRMLPRASGHLCGRILESKSSEKMRLGGVFGAS